MAEPRRSDSTPFPPSNVPVYGLEEPPEYSSVSGLPTPQTVVGENPDFPAKPPSYDKARESGDSSSFSKTKPKITDKKKERRPLTVFADPISALPANSNDIKFIRALKETRNSVEMLEKELEEVHDMNARDENLGTALQVAVDTRKVEIVRLLLEKGSHPDVEGGIAGTALKRASSNNDWTMINLLLDFGANPNIEEGEGTYIEKEGPSLSAASQPGTFDLLLSRGASPDTPGIMHSAIANRSFWKVQKLLEAGAEVEMRYSMYPYSPLNKAASIGDEEVLDLLLAYGASPDAPATGTDKNPSTFLPLVAAIYGRRDQCVRRLVEGGSSPLKCRLLQLAASLGQTETVKFLLEVVGQDVNEPHRESGGKTALMESASNGRIDALKYLLSRQAKVDFRYGGFTALTGAIQNTHSESVRILLGAGADSSNAEDLREAIRVGSSTIVNLLIDAGADVRGDPHPAVSPMQQAVKLGRVRMIELLTSRGASIVGHDDMRDDRCEKAQQEAAEQTLSTHTLSSSSSILLYAIECQQLACVKALMRLGAKVDSSDLLLNAVKGGSLALLRHLVDSGAIRFDVARQKLNIAIEAARALGHTDIVDYLCTSK